MKHRTPVPTADELAELEQPGKVELPGSGEGILTCPDHFEHVGMSLFDSDFACLPYGHYPRVRDDGDVIGDAVKTAGDYRDH